MFMNIYTMYVYLDGGRESDDQQHNTSILHAKINMWSRRKILYFWIFACW